MAHFVRIRSVGMWTVSSTVLSAEFESFDANLYKAINGDDGGTWAPASAIVLGGSGLTISSAPLSLSSAAVTWTDGTLVLSGPDVHGTADLDGTLRWNSADGTPHTMQFDNYVTVSFQDGSDVSKATLNGSTFSIALPVTINSGGSLTIASGATMTYQGTTKPTLASRSISRIQEGAPWTSGGWAGLNTTWYTTDVTASILSIPLHVPHGATLTAVSVKFKPASGHGALPAAMPQLCVYKLVDGVESQLGATVVDSSANVPTYETKHSLTVSGLSDTADRTTTRYVACFTSENGTANASYYSTSVTYNAVSIDED